MNRCFCCDSELRETEERAYNNKHKIHFFVCSECGYDNIREYSRLISLEIIKCILRFIGIIKIERNAKNGNTRCEK